jgi:hypothetical protein
MIRTHPQAREVPGLTECVEACFDCAQTCIACADACLAEQDVASLVRCIRLNQDCASICQASGEVLSRLTEMDKGIVRLQLQACIEACRVCGDECERHGRHMEHCRICAEVCRRCGEACTRLLATL